MKSKFVEKLGDQYEIMSGYEVAKEIDKIFKNTNYPLSSEQYKVLYSALVIWICHLLHINGKKSKIKPNGIGD